MPGPPAMDPESAAMMKKLVAEGALGAGVLRTDDIQDDYRTLKHRGVEFLQEPRERPYGTEALFLDDSGNWFSFTRRREGDLALERDWS
ncbi:VOC family protein [Streptomyces sp. NPDC055085]